MRWYEVTPCGDFETSIERIGTWIPDSLADGIEEWLTEQFFLTGKHNDQ